MNAVTLAPLLAPTVHVDDKLYEIIDGERLVKRPSAYTSWLATELFSHLINAADAAKVGYVAAQMLFDFGPGRSSYRPDVAFVSFQTWPRERSLPDDEAWAVIPDLVVEVVSPKYRHGDVLGKISNYLAYGVKTVWLVNPRTRDIYVYEPKRDIRVAASGDLLSAEPHIPGLNLDVAGLFQPAT